MDLSKSANNKPISSKGEEISPSLFMSYRSNGGLSERYRLTVNIGGNSVMLDDKSPSTTFRFICETKIF